MRHMQTSLHHLAAPGSRQYELTANYGEWQTTENAWSPAAGDTEDSVSRGGRAPRGYGTGALHGRRARRYRVIRVQARREALRARTANRAASATIATPMMLKNAIPAAPVFGSCVMDFTFFTVQVDGDVASLVTKP